MGGKDRSSQTSKVEEPPLRFGPNGLSRGELEGSIHSNHSCSSPRFHLSSFYILDLFTSTWASLNYLDILIIRQTCSPPPPVSPLLASPSSPAPIAASATPPNSPSLSCTSAVPSTTLSWISSSRAISPGRMSMILMSPCYTSNRSRVTRRCRIRRSCSIGGRSRRWRL